MPPEEKRDTKLSLDEVEKFLSTYEFNRVHRQFFSHITVIIIAAIGLITALAWDEVLQHLTHDLFGPEIRFVEKLYIAIFITFVATVLSVALGKNFLKNRRK